MFAWNGKTSEQMGLIVEDMPALETADGNFKEISVLGRNGSLFIENTLPTIDKAVTVHYIGKDYLKLIKWLRGSGTVEFNNLKGHYYKAVINNSIPISEIVRNKLSRFPIIFTCQPCSYLKEGEQEIEITEPTILNCVKCTAESFPEITITGTGNCRVGINNKELRLDLSPVGADETFTLTVYTEDMYSDFGERVTGDFPTLNAGDNNIYFSGDVKKIIIKPKWRSII